MNTCVCCGEPIPEGRQVCRKCSEIIVQPCPSRMIVAPPNKIFINGRELAEVKTIEWFHEAIAENGMGSCPFEDDACTISINDWEV